MFDENKPKHKDGRSWDVIGPKSTYEEIVKIRDTAMWAENKNDYDVKIKRLEDGFFLKIREKQSAIDRKLKLQETQEKLLIEQKKEKKDKKQLNTRQRD